MDEAEIIRQLIAETEARPAPAPQSRWEWAKGHPGFLTYRTKPDYRREQDDKAAYFASEFMRRAPQIAAHYPGVVENSLSDSQRALQSPYTPMGPDGPYSSVGRWWGSMPQMLMAGGKMLGNEVHHAVTNYGTSPQAWGGGHTWGGQMGDTSNIPAGAGPQPFSKDTAPYPEAYDQYAKAMNNLLVFGEPFGVNKNHMRDMEEMRAEADSVSWRAPLPRAVYDELAHDAGERKAEVMGGEDYMNRSGVHGNAGMLWGGLMDWMLDPAVPATTLGGFALDAGAGMAHTLLPLAGQAAEQIRRLREGADAR